MRALAITHAGAAPFSFGRGDLKTTVLAICGPALLALPGCDHRSPEAQAVQNNAAAMEASLEAQADNMEAMADTMANSAASEAMENAADELEDAKDKVADAANARIDNLR